MALRKIKNLTKVKLINNGLDDVGLS